MIFWVPPVAVAKSSKSHKLFLKQINYSKVIFPIDRHILEFWHERKHDKIYNFMLTWDLFHCTKLNKIAFDKSPLQAFISLRHCYTTKYHCILGAFRDATAAETCYKSSKVVGKSSTMSSNISAVEILGGNLLVNFFPCLSLTLSTSKFRGTIPNMIILKYHSHSWNFLSLKQEYFSSPLSHFVGVFPGI